MLLEIESYNTKIRANIGKNGEYYLIKVFPCDNHASNFPKFHFMRVYPLTSSRNNEISFIISVTPHEVVGGYTDVGLIPLSVLLLDIGDVQTT